MEWFERERENYEAMLDTISNICVAHCAICGEELHHCEEAYQICDYDVYICNDCFHEELHKERTPKTKCENCGSEYDTMFKINDSYYCEDCISLVELCATDEQILKVKYHINDDEE